MKNVVDSMFIRCKVIESELWAGGGGGSLMIELYKKGGGGVTSMSFISRVNFPHVSFFIHHDGYDDVEFSAQKRKKEE